MKYKFLYWLRSIGVVMIVYDHLGPLRNSEWMIARLIDQWVQAPLGIVQNFGAFGVCLFYIISGFLLQAKESNGVLFFLKRFLKIIGMLICSTVVFGCFHLLVSLVAGETYWSQFSLRQWIESATLICYLRGMDSAINGSMWYLFPLVAVELLYGLCYGIMRKRQEFFPCILDVIFVLLILWQKILGWQGHPAMVWLVFVLVPGFGVFVRALYDKKICLMSFLILMGVHYLVFVASIRAFRPEYYNGQLYLVSFIYALALFVIFLLLEDKLRMFKVVEFVSDISFSLYLSHMTFGALGMSILDSLGCGFTVSFIAAVLFVVLVAAGLHWGIEVRWNTFVARGILFYIDGKKGNFNKAP